MMKFQLYTRVLDGGQAVSRVIIDCGKPVEVQQLSNDLFTVSVTRRYRDKVIDENKRRITSVFVSEQRSGIPTVQGRYIHLILLTGKDTKGAATLMYSVEDQVTVQLDLDYQVVLNKHLQFVDGSESSAGEPLTFNGYLNHHVDVFKKKQSMKGLAYREYCPEFDGGKKPLIIWLHGMGEGGHDNTIQITANRGGTAFVLKDTQRLFGGAYVVCPQCPTFWMPLEYKGEYLDHDYTKEILALIDEVCVFHPDIDEDRIYIGGCSMGGYQTIKTVLAAPHRFAAAFPICPAYEMNMKEAWKIKDVPTWFIHCMTDTTVPSSNSVKNYEHMIRAGGEAELTLYPDIRSHGESYFAHAAWIPALNNDPVSSNGMHLFEWLASHSRSNNHVNKTRNWLVPTLATTSVLAATLYHFYRKSKKD